MTTELIVAIDEEKVDVVSSLLAQETDINSEDKWGETALSLAVKLNNVEIFKLLIQAGALVNIYEEHANLLYFAVRNNRIEMAKLLLDSGADVNVTYANYDKTPLHIAVQASNVRMSKLLLDYGASVNADSKDGTPLNIAMGSRNYEMIKMFLNAGINLNDKNTDGCTPLHRAAAWGNSKIVKLLLDAGADVHARCNKYRTPLHEAIESENINIIKLLIDAGADVNAKDETGITPLHHAINETSDKNIFTFLLNSGADAAAKDRDGNTPMHLALKSFNFDSDEILKILLNSGIDVNEKNNAGNTLLHEAARYITDFKILMEAGGNVNEYNPEGFTPFAVLIHHLTVAYWDENDFDVNIISSVIECTDVNLICKKENGKNFIANILNSDFSSSKQIIYEKILKHIAKLKVLNVPVDSSILNTISGSNIYNDRFTLCVEELEKAKATKLKNCWVSFLNLLVDDELKLVKFAGNKDLVKDFNKTSVEAEFPVYGGRMQSNMSKAIEARKYFDEASNNLSYYLPIYDPTHLIIRNILETLKEEDWKNLSGKKRFIK